MSAASKTSDLSYFAPGSVGSFLQRGDRRVEILRARTRGRGDSRTSSRPARSCRPARRPRSTCCRPSSALPCDRPRIASPVYSMHVAGAAVGGDLADEIEDQVLGRDAAAAACRRRAAPASWARDCSSVCVASTCSTSLVPMPKASAPNAPCVAVWLSPQTIVMPGCVQAQLRPDDVDDALLRIVEVVQPDAELRQLFRSVSICCLRDRIDDRQRCDRSSARCGRPWPRSARAGGPCGRPAAAPRTPGRWSLRGPVAGRCTESSACPARHGRRGRPRSSRTSCGGGTAAGTFIGHKAQRRNDFGRGERQSVAKPATLHSISPAAVLAMGGRQHDFAMSQELWV